MALKKIGSLWKKTDKHEVPFFSGVLDLGVLGTVNIAVFENTKKEDGDKSPDASLFVFDDSDKFQPKKKG